MRRLIYLIPMIAAILTLPGFMTRQPEKSPSGETILTKHVEGPFQVKLAPQQDEGSPSNLGRMTINKTYKGALSATGTGQMLTGMTAVKGSAGYVAMELVEGTLEGRKGSFIVQHSGTMSDGAQHLSISVIPNSGTGDLEGLSGQMQIKIENGEHFYIFDYTLPE